MLAHRGKGLGRPPSILRSAPKRKGRTLESSNQPGKLLIPRARPVILSRMDEYRDYAEPDLPPSWQTSLWSLAGYLLLSLLSVLFAAVALSRYWALNPPRAH
jgi:hypothetical protein